MGFGSLAVIVIGLIVTWAGYIRGVRWTWFVTFVIVWGWEFPVFMLLYFHRWKDFDFTAMLASAIREKGLGRDFAEVALQFLLMVLALVLPLKTFMLGWRGGSGEASHADSSAPDKPALSEKWQGKWDMKIRRDVLAVSSVLFSIALLILAPAMLRAAATLRESSLWGYSVDTLDWPQNCFAPAGFTSLAVILTGLIVTWTGYIRGVRWTWLVMFVVVWIWAFPVLMLPYLLPRRGLETVAQSFAGTISRNGVERSFLEIVLAFMLMLLALALPLKTFFLGPKIGPSEPTRVSSGD